MRRRRLTTSSKRGPTIVPISCPDCAGVLSTVEESVYAHQIYCCQIGHRYSTRSLIEAKEEAVERTLWSVASLLVHVGILYEQLQRELNRFDGKNFPQLRQRVRETRHHKNIVEELIRGTHAWSG